MYSFACIVLSLQKKNPKPLLLLVHGLNKKTKSQV